MDFVTTRTLLRIDKKKHLHIALKILSIIISHDEEKTAGGEEPNITAGR